MNAYQKICIALGAIIVAIMLAAFPITKEVETSRTGFGAVQPEKSIFSQTPQTEIVVDYPTTAMKTAGVVAVTAAVTVLLGFIKK